MIKEDSNSKNSKKTRNDFLKIFEKLLECCLHLLITFSNEKWTLFVLPFEWAKEIRGLLIDLELVDPLTSTVSVIGSCVALVLAGHLWLFKFDSNCILNANKLVEMVLAKNNINHFIADKPFEFKDNSTLKLTAHHSTLLKLTHHHYSSIQSKLHFSSTPLN